MKSIFTTSMILAAMLLGSGPAWSASANQVVQSCKAAIWEAEGSQIGKASLKRIKPRGSSYETWFNISSGDRELKSYCYMKRGAVEQLVTTEGRWSSNPKRPKSS